MLWKIVVPPFEFLLLDQTHHRIFYTTTFYSIFQIH